MATQQFGGEVFVDWNFPPLQSLDLDAVVVDGNYFMPDFRETNCRDKSHIARPYYRYSHVASPRMVCREPVLRAQMQEHGFMCSSLNLYVDFQIKES